MEELEKLIKELALLELEINKEEPSIRGSVGRQVREDLNRLKRKFPEIPSKEIDDRFRAAVDFLRSKEQPESINMNIKNYGDKVENFIIDGVINHFYKKFTISLLTVVYVRTLLVFGLFVFIFLNRPPERLELSTTFYNFFYAAFILYIGSEIVEVSSIIKDAKEAREFEIETLKKTEHEKKLQLNQ